MIYAFDGFVPVVHESAFVHPQAAVTGNGRADKTQVTAMVTRLLRQPDELKPADAADALALAICHLWRGHSLSRLDAAVAAAGRSSR